jgi:SAM-dependent methyltransferase
MPTNYDDIAEQYKRSKQVPWRYYIEQYSLCKLLGDVSGASVLDLACGEGHYTRMLKRMGASRVVGVDQSPKMIELATAAERRDPLGIEYLIEDARALRFKVLFDVVIAAYLLNYARSQDELLAMAEAVHRSLKPGGRFVTVNDNPEQHPAGFGNTRKYGFVKSVHGDVRDGVPIVYTFLQDGEEFVVENYHLNSGMHLSMFRQAGFSDVQWYAPELDATHGMGADYWSDFVDNPPIALFACTKGTRPPSRSTSE